MEVIEQERKKIRNRVLFTYDKKEKILRKSRGLCSHCGKSLTIENMTVDHVIPLSKGGTNETKNLVALCKECNADKSNYVIDPFDYYKYLDNIFLVTLSKVFDSYCNEVQWLSKKNLFTVDRFLVENVNMTNKIFVSYKEKFTKAKYSDLDDIYVAYLKYFRKNNRVIDAKLKQELKDFITTVFTEGMLLYQKNSSGDVAFVVPMYLNKVVNVNEDLEYVNDETLNSCIVEDDTVYTLCIGKVLVLYDKPKYVTLFFEFLKYILIDGGLCWNGDDILLVPFEVSFFNFGISASVIKKLLMSSDTFKVTLDRYYDTIVARGFIFSISSDNKKYTSIIDKMDSLSPQERGEKVLCSLEEFKDLCEDLAVKVTNYSDLKARYERLI